MYNLKDFIFKKNVLPLDTCDAITDMQKKRTDWEKHDYLKLGDYKVEDALFEYRSSFENEAMMINYFLVNAVLEYNDLLAKKLSFGKYTCYSGVQSCSPLRFNRCGNGASIEQHHDHIKGLFGPHESGVPILSIVGLLNDDFEGGEFTLWDDVNADLKKGDILIFPSTFLYSHRVNPVTNGIRYSFVGWAY